VTNPTTHDPAALTATVDTHLDGYAEPDRDRRRALLHRAWHPDGSLLDPPFDGRGVEQIAALTDVVLEHFPGHRFRRTTELALHHDRLRYGWELVAADGTVSVTGLDVGRIDDEGRLVEVVGFFGELPTTGAAA